MQNGSFQSVILLYIIHISELLLLMCEHQLNVVVSQEGDHVNTLFADGWFNL